MADAVLYYREVCCRVGGRLRTDITCRPTACQQLLCGSVASPFEGSRLHSGIRHSSFHGSSLRWTCGCMPHTFGRAASKKLTSTGCAVAQRGQCQNGLFCGILRRDSGTDCFRPSSELRRSGSTDRCHLLSWRSDMCLSSGVSHMSREK